MVEVRIRLEERGNKWNDKKEREASDAPSHLWRHWTFSSARQKRKHLKGWDELRLWDITQTPIFLHQRCVNNVSAGVVATDASAQPDTVPFARARLLRDVKSGSSQRRKAKSQTSAERKVLPDSMSGLVRAFQTWPSTRKHSETPSLCQSCWICNLNNGRRFITGDSWLIPFMSLHQLRHLSETLLS